MRINYGRINLFAGIANLSSNIKLFDLSRDDIEHICRFFGLGDLRGYEKEKGVTVSHYNAVVFIATTKGQYILKFYPPNSAKSIVAEYILNHILLHHHFLTPTMYAGLRGQPFCPSNNRLVACYAYINAPQAWQAIHQRNTLSKINAALLALKKILSETRVPLPCPKQKSIWGTLTVLRQDTKGLMPCDQKDLIDAYLLAACRTYHHNQQLFTRQRLHTNAHLDNFLIYKGKIYTLDLSHVQEDHILADLRDVVVSCMLIGSPAATIKTVINDYLAQHGLRQELFLVLDTLIKIELIKNYLKNIQYEKSVGLSVYPKALKRAHIPKLSQRKKFIISLLKKMNALYRLMV
jgi:Ser/Thr protein kinase RdoA (MazF antagonist)